MVAVDHLEVARRLGTQARLERRVVLVVLLSLVEVLVVQVGR